MLTLKKLDDIRPDHDADPAKFHKHFPDYFPRMASFEANRIVCPFCRYVLKDARHSPWLTRDSGITAPSGTEGFTFDHVSQFDELPPDEKTLVEEFGLHIHHRRHLRTKESDRSDSLP